MKNIVIDYEAETITVSSAFNKKATRINTPEYKEMQRVREAHKGFRIVVKHFKTNKSQDRHASLTYDKMREHINKNICVAIVDKDEKKRELEVINLGVLERAIQLSKCHSNGYCYPKIKSWFLKNYPEIDTLGLPTENADMENNNNGHTSEGDAKARTEERNAA